MFIPSQPAFGAKILIKSPDQATGREVGRQIADLTGFANHFEKYPELRDTLIWGFNDDFVQISGLSTHSSSLKQIALVTGQADRDAYDQAWEETRQSSRRQKSYTAFTKRFVTGEDSQTIQLAKGEGRGLSPAEKAARLVNRFKAILLQENPGLWNDILNVGEETIADYGRKWSGAEQSVRASLQEEGVEAFKARHAQHFLLSSFQSFIESSPEQANKELVRVATARGIEPPAMNEAFVAEVATVAEKLIAFMADTVADPELDIFQEVYPRYATQGLGLSSEAVQANLAETSEAEKSRYQNRQRQIVGPDLLNAALRKDWSHVLHYALDQTCERRALQQQADKS